jgi:hypothetical protein
VKQLIVLPYQMEIIRLQFQIKQAAAAPAMKQLLSAMGLPVQFRETLLFARVGQHNFAQRQDFLPTCGVQAKQQHVLLWVMEIIL